MFAGANAIRIICDSTEVRSGIPAFLKEHGVAVAVKNLRTSARRREIERRTRGRWRAPRADYLLVGRDGRIVASVERKTWPGMWRDLCSLDRDRRNRLKAQLASLSRLPCPTLVLEGGIPAVLRRRERALKRVVAGAKARGIEVLYVQDAMATATMLWKWWRLLETLACPAPV